MVALSLDTWVSLGALLGVGISLAGVMRSGVNRLDRRIDRLEDRVEERFDKVDDRFGKVEERFDKVDDRLGKVDDRVFALAVGLKPIIDQQTDPAA